MRTSIKLITLASVFCLLLSGIAFGGNKDGSVVIITSPKNGAVVGSTVDLKYDLKKGTQGSHVHAYVDGQYQKGFKGTLKGLAKGKREITVTVANADHDLLAASDTVTVEVK